MKCTVKGHQECVFGGFRQLLSAGPDRRRQLGDLEFSNRYAEFLRSRAKHSSICAFLQRMQGFKKRWEARKHRIYQSRSDKLTRFILRPTSQTYLLIRWLYKCVIRGTLGDVCWLFLHPQWGGGQHGEGEPAAETVHVSIWLAERPVRRSAGINEDNKKLPSCSVLRGFIKWCFRGTSGSLVVLPFYLWRSSCHTPPGGSVRYYT